MSVNLLGYNQVYGMTNAVQPVLKNPVAAGRAPESTDFAQVGQIWIYDNQVWMFTSANNWTELAAQGNAGVFTSLTVNGPTALNGALDVETANAAITLNSGTAQTSIGTNADATSIVIGNATGGTSVEIASGTGGIELAPVAGNLNVQAAQTAIVASTLSATLNALTGVVSFVGAANITAGGTATITLTNSYFALSQGVLFTIYNNNISNNGGTGGAIAITGTATEYSDVHSMIINIKNNGAGSIIAGTDNIILTFMVIL